MPTVNALAGGIPSKANAYKRDLIRIAHTHVGLDAPIARYAAQIHQESTWRSDAQSQYADGLAQFTPSTAKWIAEIYPDHLEGAAPFSPRWAMTALVIYDRHLLNRVKPWHARDVTECDRWAMTLSAYNGGPGWLRRDRRLAAAAGDDPDRWFGHVEHHTNRAAWAELENRHYPVRILHQLEPRYLQAGWPGVKAC
nr:transglycosylase SLT domain-containing protein [Solemya pervernicosa gill symbiont]